MNHSHRPPKLLFFWIIIAALAAGATYTFLERVRDVRDASAVPEASSDASPLVVEPSSDMQNVLGDGYTLSIPADWRIEETGSDTIAAYDGSTACKTELSEFPYPSDGDDAGWIGQRIGADPSLAVAEQSSEDVSVNGGTGVRWNGTIDGAPTTLVYAFGGGHAYEIAPSPVGASSSLADGSADGNAQCENSLDDFLSGFSVDQTAQ